MNFLALFSYFMIKPNHDSFNHLGNKFRLAAIQETVQSHRAGNMLRMKLKIKDYE